MAHAELPDAGRVSHFEIDAQLPTLAEKAVLGAFDGLANPTASVGLVAVNGVATTAIRSDGAPALDQGIVPTWTGLHTFEAGVVVELDSAVAFQVNQADTTNVFTVDTTNARVGIGTATPDVALEIKGNLNLDAASVVISFQPGGSTRLVLGHDGVTGQLVNSAGHFFFFNTVVGKNIGFQSRRAILFAEYGSGLIRMWIEADTGRVGVGTVGPDRLLHVEASDAVTAAVTYAQRLGHATSGAAAALFGTGVEHELEDAGGAMQVASEAVTLWAVATAGAESPLYRLSTYPAGSVGPGYAGFWTWDGVDGNVRTAVPNGAGDVAKGGRFMYCIYLDTAAAFASGSIEATPGGGAVDLYNVGGDQFTLTVAADGSVSVVRAAGADTADIALWALWIN